MPVLVLLAACSGSGGDPQQHLPRPANPSLTVLVSNQSFDLPTVDVEIEIDGKKAISGDFDVEGQHTWVPFDFAVTPGNHTMKMTTAAGEVTLDKTFVMDDRKWIVVNFWYYAAGSPEPTPPQFSFHLFDEQPLFE
jgi:hypothetical protein